MAADYIPSNDLEFDLWASNFVSHVTGTPTLFGETTTTAAALGALYDAWHDALTDYQGGVNSVHSFLGAKEDARDAAVPEFRAMIGRIQARAGTDDSQRGTLGIPVHDHTPTPAALPATVPVLEIDTSTRLAHRVNFADQGTPTAKAKPAGVYGCEIWVKIGGPPPGDSSDCVYLATDTKTPYVATYDSADAGQTAHYMARWVNTRHEAGLWGPTESATIGA